jgi:hypothetical protein
MPKTPSHKRICNLTSSGTQGQYVLFRGRPGSTGFDGLSTALAILAQLERESRPSNSGTAARAASCDDGRWKVTVATQPSLFDGENG